MMRRLFGTGPGGFAAALALISCAGDGSDKPGDTGATDVADADTDADADSDTDADADADADSDADADPAGTARLAGTITQSGGPVEGLQLRLCRGALCRNGETDAAGSFAFNAVPSEWHAFEIVTTGPSVPTVMVPLVFADDEQRSITIDIPTLPPGTPLTASPAEHLAGEGLYLSVATGDLEPPLFGEEATSVAGVRVPEESFLPVDGIEGTVLAMWYVEPFDYLSIDPGGIPVRIIDEWGLDGQTLEVYVGSYADSAWLDAGTATSNGASIIGASLPVLSTVILVQPAR